MLFQFLQLIGDCGAIAGVSVGGYQYVKNQRFRGAVNGVISNSLTSMSIFKSKPTNLEFLTTARERGQEALTSQKESLFRVTARLETARIDLKAIEGRYKEDLDNVNDYKSHLQKGEAGYDRDGLVAQVELLVEHEEDLEEARRDVHVLDLLVKSAERGKSASTKAVRRLGKTIVRLQGADEAASAQNAGVLAIETQKELNDPASKTGMAARRIVEDAFAADLRLNDTLGTRAEQDADKLKRDRKLDAKIAQLGLADVLARGGSGVTTDPAPPVLPQQPPRSS